MCLTSRKIINTILSTTLSRVYNSRNAELMFYRTFFPHGAPRSRAAGASRELFFSTTSSVLKQRRSPRRFPVSRTHLFGSFGAAGSPRAPPSAAQGPRSRCCPWAVPVRAPRRGPRSVNSEARGCRSFPLLPLRITSPIISQPKQRRRGHASRWAGLVRGDERTRTRPNKTPPFFLHAKNLTEETRGL